MIEPHPSRARRPPRRPLAVRPGQAAPWNCRADILTSLSHARLETAPFPHLLLDRLLLGEARAALVALPLPPTSLEGRSGRRDYHNDRRIYFTREFMAAHPVAAAIAGAFQDSEVADALELALQAPIHGAFLRVEYALDLDGFWLEPHTDVGAKALSLLIPLPVGRRQSDLGTDLYHAPGAWARRLRFAPGAGVAFRPSDRSWHGFEPRRIVGVRRSLIVNYVTAEWRSREQLAFPDRPVG